MVLNDSACASLKSAYKQITELESIFWYSRNREAYANIIVFVHKIVGVLFFDMFNIQVYLGNIG